MAVCVIEMRIAGFLGMWLGVSCVCPAQDVWENPPISYSATAASDPVTVLERGIRDGSVQVSGGTSLERVRSILALMKIPEESQILVFSKTSKQNSLISPWNPRALYFSENAFAAYVPGGQMEVISHDPILGPVFHVIDLGEIPAPPRLQRATSDCLSCHGTARTLDVPGVMVRSVFADADGRPLLAHGSFQVNATTPLGQRWGGYYVTGHSALAHLGNRIFREDETPVAGDSAPPLASLTGKIDTSRYARATSDIVALLVLEHQCQVYDLMIAASYRYRRAEWMGRLLDPHADPDTASAGHMADSDASDIVDALLFKDAASLGDGVEGDEAFQKAFTRRFPVSADGGSLADFHLGGRIFKNRCSYMIYSKVFQGLPPRVKSAVIKRLHVILESAEPMAGFDYLRAPERARIAAILRETLPAYRQ